MDVIHQPNFDVDAQDLRILFLKTQTTKFSTKGFKKFVKECQEGYTQYYNRNINDVIRYGVPKTYSQWINGQIIVMDWKI